MTRPNPTLSLRVPPFTMTELESIVGALKDEGFGVRNADLVAVLIQRATALVGDGKALNKLGGEVVAHRKKAKPLGF